ncbi:MAG: lipoyl synthase [Prevotellaceae bacterium]|jgi:lipoic acid synthetase|nr:lipoyl synthase [Prevotellaceae bacterium]
MAHVRKPEWLKIDLRADNHFAQVSSVLKCYSLHTICTSGRCPNMAECWSRGTATFMILGDVCTRSCKFCNTATGRPLPPDPDEPQRLAESVKQIALKHAVITSVARDDLPDYGAAHWAKCIEAIFSVNPATTVEALIPDFRGDRTLIDKVIEVKPAVISHNIETVRRLTPAVRSAAKYDVSLETLAHIARSGIPAKSGLMLGLGETEAEIFQTMDDLRTAGCTILTIGQYLQPSRKHLPVEAYIHPDTFAEYKTIALNKGFKKVESAPLVRSSYRAEQHII